MTPTEFIQALRKGQLKSIWWHFLTTTQREDAADEIEAAIEQACAEAVAVALRSAPEVVWAKWCRQGLAARKATLTAVGVGDPTGSTKVGNYRETKAQLEAENLWALLGAAMEAGTK